MDRIIISSKDTGWKKEMPIRKRRNAVLRASTSKTPEKYLEAAKRMQALSNLTTDYRTKSEARKDALHFFRLYNKYKNK